MLRLAAVATLLMLFSSHRLANAQTGIISPLAPETGKWAFENDGVNYTDKSGNIVYPAIPGTAPTNWFLAEDNQSDPIYPIGDMLTSGILPTGGYEYLFLTNDQLAALEILPSTQADVAGQIYTLTETNGCLCDGGGKALYVA